MKHYSPVDQLRFIGMDVKDVYNEIMKDYPNVYVRFVGWDPFEETYNTVITLEARGDRVNIHSNADGKFERITTG